jgi:hypothetical protein
MTRSQLLSGCSIVIVTVAGGLISSAAVNRHIAADVHARQPAVAGSNARHEEAGEGNCVSLTGERFGWHFPNVPFGARNCDK